MRKTKKTILIDLDGVLNTYTGDFKPYYIPPLRKGAKDFLSELHERFTIKVFSSRPKEKITEWLKKYEIDTLISGVTNIKEPAYLYIDDRAVCFKGSYRKALKLIDRFKVWYKE